jgi:hypothetical protein
VQRSNETALLVKSPYLTALATEVIASTPLVCLLRLQLRKRRVFREDSKANMVELLLWKNVFPYHFYGAQEVYGFLNS